MKPQTRYLAGKIALICLVGLILLSSLASSNTAVNAKPKSKHSTPELIMTGLQERLIDSDTAYLYLAYALYDDVKLPAEYRGDTPYDGTLLVEQLRTALSKRKMRSDVATEISNIVDSFCDTTPLVVPPDPLTHSVDTSHFYIEYGTITGGLSINDYIAALEASWNQEIDVFGWAAPPVFSDNPSPNNLYHVRIMDLPPGVYGLVTDKGSYAGIVGDNPNTSWDDGDAAATCMVLNNDYVNGFGSSPSARAALDATAAHEFNHSIQYGYTSLLPEENTQGIVPNDGFVEGSATWMEDEVFDSANDNYNYLWPIFEYSSLGEPVADTYAYWIIFRGLTERYGTGIADGGEQVMQDFWEDISKGSGSDSITALDSALAQKGTNLSDAFQAFAVAVKFNKTCGEGYSYPYCFEEGSDYIAAAGNTTAHGTINVVGGSYSTTLAGGYTLKWVELPTHSIYNVILKNTYKLGEFRASIVCDTGSAFIIREFPNIVRASESTSLEGLNTIDCNSVVAVIVNQNLGNYFTNSSFDIETIPLATPTPTVTSTPACSPAFTFSYFNFNYCQGTYPGPCSSTGSASASPGALLGYIQLSEHVNYDIGGYPRSGQGGLDAALGIPSGATVYISYSANVISGCDGGAGVYYDGRLLPVDVSTVVGTYPTYWHSFRLMCVQPNSSNHNEADITAFVYSSPSCTSTPIPTGSPIVTPTVTIASTFTLTPTPAPNPCSLQGLLDAWGIGSSNSTLSVRNSPISLRSLPSIQQAVIDLDLFYRVRDDVLSGTVEGQHYIDLYYATGPEISQLFRDNHDLAEEALATLNLWQPDLQALVDGQGSSVTITDEQVQAIQTFLDHLSAKGGPDLQETIANEEARRPLAQAVGMNMDQAWGYLNGYNLTWLSPLNTVNPYRAETGRTIPVEFTLQDFQGNFVTDDSVVVKILDANGNMVAGPIAIGDNPTSGLVVEDNTYHYNFQTMGMADGVYTIQVSYSSANAGQPAVYHMQLMTGKKK